jgi:hypothetical protein
MTVPCISPYAMLKAEGARFVLGEPVRHDDADPT